MPKDNVAILEDRLTTEEVDKQLTIRIESEKEKRTVLGEYWRERNIETSINEIKKGFWVGKLNPPKWLVSLPLKEDYSEGEQLRISIEVGFGNTGLKTESSTMDYLVVAKLKNYYIGLVKRDAPTIMGHSNIKYIIPNI